MKDTQTSWVSAFWCDSSRYQTVAVSESRRGRKHAYKPESFLFPPDRRVCVRLRLQNMASHQKNTQSKMSFRCDFSRYQTVAVSESRHSRLGLSYFLKTEAVLVPQEPTGRQQDAMSARATAAAGVWRCQTRPQCRFCLF